MLQYGNFYSQPVPGYHGNRSLCSHWQAGEVEPTVICWHHTTYTPVFIKEIGCKCIKSTAQRKEKVFWDNKSNVNCFFMVNSCHTSKNITILCEWCLPCLRCTQCLPVLVRTAVQRRPFSQTQAAFLFSRFRPLFGVRSAPLIQCFYKTAERSNNSSTVSHSNLILKDLLTKG